MPGLWVYRNNHNVPSEGACGLNFQSLAHMMWDEVEFAEKQIDFLHEKDKFVIRFVETPNMKEKSDKEVIGLIGYNGYNVKDSYAEYYPNRDRLATFLSSKEMVGLKVWLNGEHMSLATALEEIVDREEEAKAGFIFGY